MFLTGLFTGILLASLCWAFYYKRFKVKVQLIEKGKTSDLRSSYLVLLDEMKELRDIVKRMQK